MNDWEPSTEEIAISRARIAERLAGSADKGNGKAAGKVVLTVPEPDKLAELAFSEWRATQ